MKQRLLRLGLVLLCMLLGWIFGYIKVPYFETTHSFWIGFIGCLGIFAFVFMLYWAWNYNKATKLIETTSNIDAGSGFQRFFKFKFLLLFACSVLFFYFLFSQLFNKSLYEKLNLAKEELKSFQDNINLEEQRNNMALLLALIHELDSTEENFQNKAEADAMIHRIAALSASFKITKEWDMENKVYQSLSSERGMLLLILITSIRDSNYFTKIKQNVSFYGADLRNADLNGFNLSGIDLSYANLQYANLQGTNLNNANLKGANMLGINLNHAKLVEANLIAAKLNWAKINEADLHLSKLDSSDLSNTTIQNSNLNHTTFIQTSLCNAILHQSDLSYSTFSGTNMSNVNLTKTKLNYSDVYNTNLSNAILNDAIIHENWIERLSERNNVGVKEMLEKYQMVADSSMYKDSIIYCLKPKMQ
ncbi:MAG: pentapeptide repeat-containing protein [Saprospiraceae bacterium]|nr:pentapeptide repeat-containing protein [Saprospiraceae bacterium]MBK7913003.1 pentapeptide repeat-containing protein [Saprospiraceae bacterium]